MDTAFTPAGDKVGDALKAQRFRMLEDIAQELSGDIVFPTYFDAVVRLRKEFQDPACTIPRIAALVSVEPLISAKVMRLANSVACSPGGNGVRDLSTAINRLGLEAVRSTALAIAMGQLLRSREMAAFSDLARGLWEHSLETAAAARVLARAHTRLNPETAQLAGLVHDLGAFYMLYRAASYPELRQRPDTIRYLIGHWHENIGVALMNAIGLPEEIVEATADHDQPRPLPMPVKNLAEVVHVANLLAGGHAEWLFQDRDPGSVEKFAAGEFYAPLLEEIDAATLQMKAVFS